MGLSVLPLLGFEPKSNKKSVRHGCVTFAKGLQVSNPRSQFFRTSFEVDASQVLNPRPYILRISF